MSKPESEEIKRVPVTNGAKAAVASETPEGQKEQRAEVGIPVPPVLFMADHFGYADGVSCGLTTYFLQIIPALLNAGIDLMVPSFLREPHVAADELHQYGVKPIFLSARVTPSCPPARCENAPVEYSCRRRVSGRRARDNLRPQALAERPGDTSGFNGAWDGWAHVRGEGTSRHVEDDG
jgi:hypothetical protein